MSTRGTIAMVVDGGAVDTIFCRYDSYLEWVGGCWLCTKSRKTSPR